MIKRLLYRFRKIASWLPVLWRDVDFDHTGLTAIMEFKLRRMANYFEKYGHYVGCERSIRQMKEAAALCKRMSDEDYTWKDEDTKHADKLQDADLERLCLIFIKHLRTWWD